MAELTLFDGDTKLIYDKVSRTVHRETNADRIRAMSDEELANWWCFMQMAYDFQNPVETLKWLKKEVET